PFGLALHLRTRPFEGAAVLHIQLRKLLTMVDTGLVPIMARPGPGGDGGCPALGPEGAAGDTPHSCQAPRRGGAPVIHPPADPEPLDVVARELHEHARWRITVAESCFRLERTLTRSS
ncbi:hypothetical protein, partial [Methylobacterium frigidaeris]|uniref:hypothetical protein n=1 Tax=Methylobacterium frigidaeris TaxID=2038277 RepID=UPI001EE09B44